MIVEGTLILMLFIELLIFYRVGRTNRRLRLFELKFNPSNKIEQPPQFLIKEPMSYPIRSKSKKEPPKELQYKKPCEEHQYTEGKDDRWYCINCNEAWS